MKKNIWIFNHYATNMYKNKGGRHLWFADNLIKTGHHPTVFCATTVHNSDENIDTGSQKYTTDQVKGIPFVFIKTPSYLGNGKQRIKNILAFYKNLFPVAKEYAKVHGKPDVILASSAHPLTLVAGIKIAKKLGVPCICEVRDLWPESLIEYGLLKKNHIFSKILYHCEKWIYKKADKIIFTMEGGKDYIIEKGWNKESGGSIDLSKVYHINNGVDLETFHYNMNYFKLDDVELNKHDNFKVVYTGSIRASNEVKKIVEAAEIIQKQGIQHIKFFIFGRGPDKEKLEKYCHDHQVKNIQFKGFVEKEKIPYILSKSDLNIFHFQQNKLKNYGSSMNKMFEYFASGKPTITDCEFGYDLIRKYKCGVVINNASAQQLAEAIIKLSKMSPEQYSVYSQNALKAAQDYDFKLLTRKLEQLF